MSIVELEMESVVSCPLCGSFDEAVVDQVNDTLMVEINRYLPTDYPRLTEQLQNIRRQCADCGLIYLSPRLSDKSLSTVYSYWYGFAYQRVMGDPEHVSERLREFEKHHLRLLEEYCTVRGRLLDVGCGSGLFLQLAQCHGWQVSGVELDPDTAAWAREKGGIPDVRCGTLDVTLESNECFDVVTMFDYLEHTTNPGRDLDLLIERLAPDGTLMIRVPNATSWQARLMGSGWLAIMPTHLSYFTPEVLQKTLVKYGLQIQYARAGNSRREIDIFRQRWRWLNKRLQNFREKTATHNQSLSEINQTPWHSPRLGEAARRWLYSLWIEQVDHVGGLWGYGNNLTVIARKAK